MKFAFDGGDTTARDLHQHMTAYTVGALQSALEAGCQTRGAVVTWLEQRERRRKDALRQAGVAFNAQRVRA